MQREGAQDKMVEHAGFSLQWEKLYSEGAHQSVWPWSDLVALVMRHTRAPRQGLRALELGAGAGANVPFFQSLGIEYSSVEGSAVAVDHLRKRFPELADRFGVGDFTRTLPQGPFDLIVDRSALTHNSADAIRHAVSLIRGVLVPGGHYIGVDWFSTAHPGAALGRADGDPKTRTDIQSGHLVGTGRVHFSDEPFLRDLFGDFEIKLLRHKVSTMLVPDGGECQACYDIVCEAR